MGAETPASDEAVQIVHLRLCQRANELGSPIAALEEAAEEIVTLTAHRQPAVDLARRIEQWCKSDTTGYDAAIELLCEALALLTTIGGEA